MRLTTVPKRLSGKAIAAIREFIDNHTSRADLKQILLKAGASDDRVLPIQIQSDMRSSGYLSKNELLSQIFDTLWADFEGTEADGTAIEAARLAMKRHNLSPSDGAVQGLVGILAQEGIDFLNSGPWGQQEVICEQVNVMEETGLQEAAALLRKAIRRLPTDPAGATTVATSAAESVCRSALQRLGINIGAAKTLPDYFNKLCSESNIESLFSDGAEERKRVFSAIRNLSQNAYQATHVAGDRHAQGDAWIQTGPLAAAVVVSSSCTVALIVAEAIRSGNLQSTANPAGGSV